jgi:hypothetical protein
MIDVAKRRRGINPPRLGSEPRVVLAFQITRSMSARGVAVELHKAGGEAERRASRAGRERHTA